MPFIILGGLIMGFGIFQEVQKRKGVKVVEQPIKKVNEEQPDPAKPVTQ